MKTWLRDYWNGCRRAMDTIGDMLAGDFPRPPEPVTANYQVGWLVTTKAGDKVRIIATMSYQFKEKGEPLYFVQSKKTGESYSLLESEIKPKAKK